MAGEVAKTLDQEYEERMLDMEKRLEELQRLTGTPENISLETLAYLTHTDHLNNLSDKSVQNLKEVQERQEKISTLTKLLQEVNNGTSSKGELTVSAEMKELLKKVQEMGVNLDTEKGSYSKDEKAKLYSNVDMEIKDSTEKQNLQLQKLHRLEDERIESYRFVQNAHKAVSDAIRMIARNVKGQSTA